jgi:hypothetical protein
MTQTVGSRQCLCDTNVSDNCADPLNLPVWQKWVILVIVGLYAATGMFFTLNPNAVTDLSQVI